MVLEEFKLSQQFTQKTKEYYVAKTMVSMFLAEIKQTDKKVEQKGQRGFSAGQLNYEYNQEKFTIFVNVNDQNYTFYEDYQSCLSKEQPQDQ